MSDEPDPVTIEKTGGTLIARPRVKLMDDEALQLLARLIDEASGDPTGEAAGGAAPVPLVVIDLSRVAIVPSLALGSLVIIHNKCKARQQKLKLAGLQPQIRRVFTITKLDHVFELADTVEAAIA